MCGENQIISTLQQMVLVIVRLSVCVCSCAHFEQLSKQL
jgi:hypothetical protein